MPRIKHVGPKPRGGYTMVLNSLARDDNLKMQDIGLMTVLLSHDDNWNFDTTSSSQVRQSIRRLEEAGYVRREKPRQRNGVFTTGQIFVTQTPHVGFPHVDVPQMDSPHVENQPAYRRPSKRRPTKNRTLKKTKGTIPLTPTPVVPSRFPLPENRNVPKTVRRVRKAER